MSDLLTQNSHMGIKPPEASQLLANSSSADMWSSPNGINQGQPRKDELSGRSKSQGNGCYFIMRFEIVWFAAIENWQHYSTLQRNCSSSFMVSFPFFLHLTLTHLKFTIHTNAFNLCLIVYGSSAIPNSVM